MFKVAIVTDEISSDFETAVELASEWGIKNIEIRGVGDERIGSHTEYTSHHIKKISEVYDVDIVSLSPGIFKIPHWQPIYEGYTVLKWQDRYEFNEGLKLQKEMGFHLNEILPKSISFAKEVGCKNILIFSFIKPQGFYGDIPEFLIDYFRQACRVAKDEGITLLMENEHICYGDTALNTRRLIEKIGYDNLKINWDPGNSYFSNENPYPNAYKQIEDIIGHVHMKDVITHKDGSMEYVVKGEIDWEGQIETLIRSGYSGYLAIETHCRPKVKSAHETLQRIISIAGRDVLK